MDHITHTAFLWIVAGMGIAAFVLWLTMVASSEGERPDASAEASSPSPRAGDHFRLLGDPEYGLFLDEVEVPASRSVSSAA